jgi:hypothetical protein
MTKITLTAVLILLAGCTTSSGVLKSGLDTFTINTSASPGAGGTSTAKKSAYEAANQECVKQAKSINVVNERVSAPSWTDGMHTVDLTFKCS